MSLHALPTQEWEPYLTKRQVAERLGFSERWVDLKRRDEGLPAHRIGGQPRFLWSEVRDWIQQRDTRDDARNARPRRV